MWNEFTERISTMIYDESQFTTQAPAIERILRSAYIQSINVRLDAKQSITDIKKFLEENGEEVSERALYTYKKLRQESIAKGVMIESLITPVEKTTSSFDTNDEEYEEEKLKLKSELDAIDLLISKGYATLVRLGDAPINPRLMLEAIKLKSEMTQGSHGGLTTVGLKELKQVEESKYRILMEHLISFIPEELRADAVKDLPKIEEEYYFSTSFYPEYIKTRQDLALSEINNRLECWRKFRNRPDYLTETQSVISNVDTTELV